MPLSKNEIINVKITAISSDGNGIARHEGMAVFVPFSAVGDELRVKIVKVNKSYVFAIIQEILLPSQDRQAPQCAIYGKCGGCCFAHMSYEAELRAKKTFVEDALRRIGGLDVQVQDVAPSQSAERYRNKVQFPVCTSEGKVKSGFFASRSHRVIICDDCILQPKILNDIAKSCCEFFESKNINVYDEVTQKGTVRHIYMRHSVKSGKVLLCIVVNGRRLPFDSDFCAEMTRKHPEIESIVINKNTQLTNVILGKQCKTLYGSGTLKDEMCGVPVVLDPLSFYQVNTKGAELLYSTAADMAQLENSDTLLDLYCGTGTIGLAMVKRTPCKKLVGVEIVPEAVKSAQANAEQMGIENAVFICADAKMAVQELMAQKLMPDIVVLDPPRKGCDEAALNTVVDMKPRKIVMISCNISTAARDVKHLCQNGYEVQEVKPVDLFARTRHVETVILLSHKP